MSRIDTAKLQSQTSGTVPASRMARALSRNVETRPNQFETQRPVDAVPGYRPRDEYAGVENEALPSIAEIAPADLEPIAQMGGDRLLGEIARIELLLGDHRQRITNQDDAQALDAAGDMLGEMVRRLRLVHSGNDALVLKR